MRVVLLFLLLLPLPALGGELSLSAPVVDGGEAVLLQWRGSSPSVAVARFNDRLYYLHPAAEGATALLGTDLEMTPGLYPVEAAVLDRRGATEFFYLPLQVRRAQRPEERITLPPAKVSPSDPAVLRRIERERALLGALFAEEGTAPLWTAFRAPVTDPVGSPFGLRRILNGQAKSPHAGVDFRSPAGTPVHAAARGRVVLAEELFYTGKTVVLDHGEGFFTLYAHLQKFLCRKGELAEAGTILGEVGSSGRSTGPHLHWGVKLRGDRIDPLALAEVLAGEKR